MGFGFETPGGDDRSLSFNIVESYNGILDNNLSVFYDMDYGLTYSGSDDSVKAVDMRDIGSVSVSQDIGLSGQNIGNVEINMAPMEFMDNVFFVTLDRLDESGDNIALASYEFNPPNSIQQLDYKGITSAGTAQVNMQMNRINNDYLYANVGGFSGIWDVSDPANLNRVSSLSVTNLSNSIGTFDEDTGGYTGFQFGAIIYIDVSDPENPFELGTFPARLASPQQMLDASMEPQSLSGGEYVIGSGGNLTISNVSYS